MIAVLIQTAVMSFHIAQTATPPSHHHCCQEKHNHITKYYDCVSQPLIISPLIIES